MKKWEVWYSWYYEDFRAHGGNNSHIFESETKPTNEELLKTIDANNLAPCSVDCVSIDQVYEVA